MSNRGMGLHVLAGLALFAAPGCMIWLRPEWAELKKSTQPPILRLGEIKETFTGTWVAGGTQTSLRNHLLSAFARPEAAALFSGDPDSLTLNLDIVSDHEDDMPRMFVLGCLSIGTLGLLPLTYHSEWNLQCSVTVKGPDGTVVAKYPVQTTGSYDIWALPPTMFTLFAGSFRAPGDAGRIFRRMVHRVVADVSKAVDTDYPRLARWKEARALVAAQAPLNAAIGDTAYWVVYNISTPQPSGAGAAASAREYALELHRTRPQPGAAPLRRLVVGTRSGAVKTAWQWRDPKSVVFFAHGRLWHPEWKTGQPGDKLVAVGFRERAVTAKDLFAPDGLPALAATEWNDLVVAWKNRDLATLLREGRTADLGEHVAQIEQLALRANESADRENNKAEELKAAGKPGSELHREAALAYRARIEVLKPILAAIKAEVANRQR
ncbi:MAG TPA: hypothetical protein VNE39_15370 [Planctomycetota bacterium]|nr:hypothetical protein [Planctomycetota bacterium]